MCKMCAFSQRKPPKRQKFHTLITLGRSRYTYILSEEGDPVLLHQSDEVFCSVAAKDWQTDGIVVYINHVFFFWNLILSVFFHALSFDACFPPKAGDVLQKCKKWLRQPRCSFSERGQTLQMDYLKTKKRPSHRLPKEFKTSWLSFGEEK